MKGKCRCGGTLTYWNSCDVCLREQRKRQDERARSVPASPVAQQLRARIAAMTDDQVVEFWRKLEAIGEES